MNIQDTLDRQSSHYNLSGSYSNQSASAKFAMQNLYRQQLDEFLQEKNREKQREKQQKEAERREFNERAATNKQSEKLKEIAYKNYYSMLLNNQEQLQSSYVSPYSVRDNMKDSHIHHSVEEGEKRMKAWEIEDRQRQAERKNNYRNQLLKQLEEKQKLNQQAKFEENRNKEEFRKYGKLPQELEQYERKRQKEEMAKYREDLDKVKEEQDFIKKRSLSQRQNIKFYADMPQHNAIVNPLPYNIQNPYILREMNRQNSPLRRQHNSQDL